MCFCDQDPCGIEFSLKSLCSLYCSRARNVLLGKFILHLVFCPNFLSKECLLIQERFLVLNQYCFDIFFMGVCTMDYYGPVAPSYYLSAGSGPSNLSLSRPAAPPYYSSAGSGPSNLSLWASSASTLLEFGFSTPRIASFGHHAFTLFGRRPLSFESLLRAIIALHSKCPNLGDNIPVWMPYVKYEGKSMACNTRWPSIRIKRILPSNFAYFRYEVCTDGCIGCLSLNWASTR
jgi:hypothetical protein